MSVSAIGVRLGKILENVRRLGDDPTQEEFDSALQISREQASLEIEARRHGLPTQIAFRTIVTPENTNK